MAAPPFHQLSREEFVQLSFEERLEYMHALMAELRQQLADTKRQLEDSKATLARLEKKDR